MFELAYKIGDSIKSGCGTKQRPFTRSPAPWSNVNRAYTNLIQSLDWIARSLDR